MDAKKKSGLRRFLGKYVVIFYMVAKIDCGKIHVCKKLYKAYVDVIIYTVTLNKMGPSWS